jgi:hypothetical protein
MRLVPFAVASPDGVRSFLVDAVRGDGATLQLSYRLEADLGGLRIPGPSGAARADGLWQHTCFEAFIAPADGTGYWELNFSPSGQWAAYCFDGYRAGMKVPGLRKPPLARWQRDDRSLALDVDLDLAAFPGIDAGRPLRLGLAAVIERQSGTITYWALHHPAEKPDFHRHEGFVLAIAASPAGAGGIAAT